MTDKKTIQKLQSLQSEKILQFIKKDINNIKIDETLKNKLKEDFKYWISNVKDSCTVIDLDIDGLSENELYDLIFKPEIVSYFKGRFFTQIEKYIDRESEKWVDVINDIYEDQNELDYEDEDDNLKTIEFLDCRTFLINILYNWFGNQYITNTDIVYFLQDGTISTDTVVREEIYDKLKTEYKGINPF